MGEDSGEVFIDGGVVFVLEEEVEQLFVGEEVEFGEGFPLGVEEEFHGVFQLFEDGVVFLQDHQVLLLLRRQFPQRKVLADLLYQFLPVALGVRVGFVLARPLPVRAREDRLEVAQVVMVLLPLAQQLPQGVQHVLLVLDPQPELSLLHLGVFADAVDHCDFLVDLCSDGPVVLGEVVDEPFAGVPHALPPEAADGGHFEVEFELLFGLEDNFFEEV